MILKNTNIEELRGLLAEAYEAGWYGTLEMKNEFVDGVIKKCTVESPKSGSKFMSTALNEINPIPSPIIINWENLEVSEREGTLRWQNVGDG